MSDIILKKAANNPKLTRKHEKTIKKQLRTVEDLFGKSDAPVTVHKDKRGRPWVANPKKYANKNLNEDLDQESNLDQEDDVYSDSDRSSNFSNEFFPEVELADLENANFLSLVQDAPKTEISTSRLALLHFDWDNGTAEDIYVLLESFLPPHRQIKKVTIYPSKFGIEKMEEEKESGPKELRCSDSEASDNEVCDPEDKKAWRNVSVKMRKRLRDYQLQRLKYFYAIIELDSKETAQEIYDKCDGFEYQSSGVCLDLRFVDEAETFEIDPLYSHLVTECTEVNKAKYVPRKFSNKALSSTRVVLDWDRTCDARTEWLRSQFKEGIDPAKTLTEETDQLGKYIALSSSGASTAASSDVDDSGPDATVPRIRKHRPPKLPSDRIRALLLGKTTKKQSEDQNSSSEEDEEVLDIDEKNNLIKQMQFADKMETNQNSSSDESYDLGSEDGSNVNESKKLEKSEKSDSDEELDFDKMESRVSDEEFSENSGDSSSSVEKLDENKIKLTRRAKMKSKMARIKQKQNKKNEKIYNLWHLDGGLFVDDARFDEFNTNPLFKISQTNRQYEHAKDFLDFIRHRAKRSNLEN